MENLYLDVVNAKDEVLAGNREALEVYGRLQELKKVIDECMAEIKEQTIEEADKYGKGEHEAYGFKFQVKNVGGRWSYKHLDWYNQYKDMEKLAKDSYKAAQNGNQFISQDGEIILPAEYTEGGRTISIKL